MRRDMGSGNRAPRTRLGMLPASLIIQTTSLSPMCVPNDKKICIFNSVDQPPHEHYFCRPVYLSLCKQLSCTTKYSAILQPSFFILSPLLHKIFYKVIKIQTQEWLQSDATVWSPSTALQRAAERHVLTILGKTSHFNHTEAGEGWGSVDRS